jgi:hypothetical protein
MSAVFSASFVFVHSSSSAGLSKQLVLAVSLVLLKAVCT